MKEGSDLSDCQENRVMSFVCFRSWSVNGRSRAVCSQWRSQHTGQMWTKWPPRRCALVRTITDVRNITSTSALCPGESTRRTRCERTAVTACDNRSVRKPRTGAVIRSHRAPPRLKSKTAPLDIFTESEVAHDWKVDPSLNVSPPAGPGARLCFSSCDMQDQRLHST